MYVIYVQVGRNVRAVPTDCVSRTMGFIREENRNELVVLLFAVGAFECGVLEFCSACPGGVVRDMSGVAYVAGVAAANGLCVFAHSVDSHSKVIESNDDDVKRGIREKPLDGVRVLSMPD